MTVQAAAEPFLIEVVDDATGHGVPLVELETVNNILHVTDSNGLVAFDEPGLMGRSVYFHVRSHGYEVPADGFGNRGVRLHVKPGGGATVKIKRLNIAERLYRITGEGIYHDSVMLGRDVPIQNPLLNAGVLGQDSTQAAVYRDRVYWFWGDTNLPGYPLGHFGTAGATSKLPANGGLDPNVGVDLDYFTNDKGESRPMFVMDKPGMIWVHGVFVVPDATGRERLVTHYARMKSLGERLEHGFAVLSDDTQRFDTPVQLADDAKHYPRGHAFPHTVDGVEYVYFADPYAVVRVPATFEAAMDPTKYETVPGADANKPVDAVTGKPIKLHRGSIRYNSFRKKWVMIAGSHGGEKSLLGDIYYLEADSPLGPWERAVRIVTHDRYSFYNPAHHAFLDSPDGRYIHFDGTYSRTFSDAPIPTPRYDYNTIMYRLDLADERLHAAEESTP